jgi:hypothetical protein
MTTTAIIEGLTILEKYRDEADGFNCGAEHDVVYAYATDRPVAIADLHRLVELGWLQDDANFVDDEETGGNFATKHYAPEEAWMYFT